MYTTYFLRWKQLLKGILNESRMRSDLWPAHTLCFYAILMAIIIKKKENIYFQRAEKFKRTFGHSSSNIFDTFWCKFSAMEVLSWFVKFCCYEEYDYNPKAVPVNVLIESFNQKKSIYSRYPEARVNVVHELSNLLSLIFTNIR